METIFGAFIHSKVCGGLCSMHIWHQISKLSVTAFPKQCSRDVWSSKAPLLP